VRTKDGARIFRQTRLYKQDANFFVVKNLPHFSVVGKYAKFFNIDDNSIASLHPPAEMNDYVNYISLKKLTWRNLLIHIYPPVLNQLSVQSQSTRIRN
jgi:hypothetical protein